MNPKILEKMGFKPTSHNEIFLDHLEVITDFLKVQCPIDKKKCISMLRGSTGISNRYVKEHIDSLLAWDIIKSHAGNYEWIFDIEKQKQEIENIKENISSEEIKPCKFRPTSGECNPFPGVTVLPSAAMCNTCKQREEA